MTPLREALRDYLALRRTLGYTLQRTEKLLGQLLTYVETQHESHLRLATTVAWATLPADAHPSWPSHRLSIARQFALYLQPIDPESDVPPRDLLPWRRCRATPYLYSDDELAAVIAAATSLRTPHRVATYQTLIGLLAVTGMRVGEALALDRDDLDGDAAVLTIRCGKFGKARALPVHGSTMRALARYLHRRDRPHGAKRVPAVFVSTTGTRLRYCNVHWTFHRLVEQAGVTARSAACRPRIHDLRHRFAVCTMLDAYREGADPHAQLGILSTYLGHADPRHTYWYLSAAPELLGRAMHRLDQQQGGTA